jgi:hypothetical protein
MKPTGRWNKQKKPTKKMKTYQITLGPMLWDIDDQKFRNIEGWDGDGSHIKKNDLAAQVEAAKSKSENVWGWEIKTIEPEEEQTWYY